MTQNDTSEFFFIIYSDITSRRACFARPLLYLFCPSCSYTHCMCYHACKDSCKGAKLAAKKVIVKESLWGIDYVNCTRMTLHTHSFVAHAHLLHPIQARDLINQFAKKLISLLTISSTMCVKLRSKRTKSTIYLHDNDCYSMFPWIKLLSYLQPITCKSPLSPVLVQSVQEASSFTCG